MSPRPQPSTEQLRDWSGLPWSAFGFPTCTMGSFCLRFSSAMPLDQADPFLPAWAVLLVLSDPEVPFQLSFEHRGETKPCWYQCKMHEHYWAECTLHRAQGRLNLPHAGEQYFGSCLQVTTRLMTESKYISYSSHRQAWAGAVPSQSDKHKTFYLLVTIRFHSVTVIIEFHHLLRLLNITRDKQVNSVSAVFACIRNTTNNRSARLILLQIVVQLPNAAHRI